MSLPFARSERVLQTDDYRTAIICAVITLPLFLAWLVWLLTGSIPNNQASEKLTFGEQDTIVANFASDLLPASLQRGDDAQLRLQLSGDEHLTTIPAVVASIDQQSDGSIDLQLYPSPEHLVVSSLPTLTGQAEIHIGNRSPLTYFLQQNRPER